MQADRRKLIVAAGGVGLLVLLIGALLRLPPNEWQQAREWGESLQQLGSTGIVVLLLVGSLASAVGLPRQLIAFVTGFAYGVLGGLLVSLLAAMGGCALAFFASRYWLNDRVRRRFPQATSLLDRLLEKDPFLKILILRLQPFGTNLLTNLTAGLSTIRASVFLVGSCIGYIPQMLVFNLIGSGVRVDSHEQLFISALLFALSLFIGFWLYFRRPN